MANSIALVSKCITLLDEVYKKESLTNVLESNSNLARAGANTHEIKIPKMSVDGLADYDRAGGYVDGDVSLTWETAVFDYDRGRAFTVDAMDNEETIQLAFGRLSSEFLRTEVVPELDAYRFAKYASASGAVLNQETLSSGDSVCNSLISANTEFDEAEIPAEGRYLFITPTLYNSIMALETYKSKKMLEGFTQIVKVPQSRFYTAVDLLDGKSSGEEAGGYKKSDIGKNINFMVISKPAIMQYTKHTVSKVITPEANQTADAWKFFYRAYGLNTVYEKKANGIYCSYSAT